MPSRAEDEPKSPKPQASALATKLHHPILPVKQMPELNCISADDQLSCCVVGALFLLQSRTGEVVMYREPSKVKQTCRTTTLRAGVQELGSPCTWHRLDRQCPHG